MKTEIKKIGIIGLGNVGIHLTRAFALESPFELLVYNRSEIPLEDQFPEITYTRNLKDLAVADLVIISVKDDAIIPILDRIEGIFPKEMIVTHCSGSIPSSIIRPYFSRYGVLYPLQTLSRKKTLDYKAVPLFITASDAATRDLIVEAGHFLSPKINYISDEQRVSLHIAAIFACNYTNALYAISQRICEDHQLNFELLKPLIRETADKVQSLNPREAQTGPAARKDWEIIHQHELFLSGYDEKLRELYREIADYISKNI